MRPHLLLPCLLLLCFAACSDDTGAESSSNSASTLTTSAGTAPDTGDETSTASTTDTATTTDTSGTGEGVCIHQCSADSDCLVDGQDLGLSCNDSLCSSDVSGCTNDEECVWLFSGWSAGMACTPGGGECDAAMQVCLDLGGEGHCAIAPSDFIECATVQMQEIMTVDIDGNSVIVCGQPTAECFDGSYCRLPCQDDGDCASAAYPVCNPNTGNCECGSDDHCATLGLPSLASCNTGLCGCSSDDQCIDGATGDQCNSTGFCGCTDDAACAGVASSFDGGMVSCVVF